MNMHTKRITTVAILVTIGLISGYIEGFINVFPVNGIKLGLSNIVLLYCVCKCSISETIIVAVLKSVLSGFLFSGIMSIFYSLSGSLISVIIMIVLYRNVKNMSIYGISMSGSCAFNIVQFLVASLIFRNFVIMINLWYVMPISLLTGIVLAEIYRIIFLRDS